MKKVSVLLLMTITLPIIGNTGVMTQGIDTAVNYSRSALKPIANFLTKLGVDVAAKEYIDAVKDGMAETSGASVFNAAEIYNSDLVSDATKESNAQELMAFALQKGMAARFFNFQEGKPLPSLGSLAIPFLAGKSLSIGISMVPGAGELGKWAGECVGRTLQFVFRNNLQYKGADYDMMTLTSIQSLSEEIAKGYAKMYAPMFSNLTPQQQDDFIHYGSISILDSIDEILLHANDGDTLTAKTILDKVPNRYLNIDHRVPTIKTTVKKLTKKKKGFGARTVGNIMTTPLVRQGDQLYFDDSSLDQERVDNMKKRGHLKEKRKFKSLEYIREAQSDEILDPSRYKAVTLEEAEKIMKEQKPTRIQRIAKKVKKLRKKQVTAAVTAPAA